MKTTHDRIAMRNGLALLCDHFVPPIARSVARRPEDADDLAQVGRLAIIDAAPRVEAYIRQRVGGAMLDSLRLGARRQHARLEDGPEPADPVTPETLLLDSEAMLSIEAAIASLQPDQAAIVIELRDRGEVRRKQARVRLDGDAPQRRGRPRKADVAAAAAALDSMRQALRKAA